jgi:hypothetical protein
MRNLLVPGIVCPVFSLLVSLAVSSVSSAQAFADGRDFKPWTLLVFVNGNNDLDPYGAMNINEMESVGSTPDLNIVVQYASKSRGTTQRFLIQKDNDPENITSPVVQDLGVVDMGSVATLKDFIHWGVTHYPAEHYFIVVWDHGTGWHGRSLSSHTFHPLDISFDENTNHMISTVELGQAMADAAQLIGHKVDIYGSDACLMAMAEIAGEMTDSVGIFAGSEEVEPTAGWPYASFLSQWTADPSMDAPAIAKLLTHEYVQSYMGGSHGTDEVTFSAFDLSGMADFEQAFSNLSYELLALSGADLNKLLAAIGASSKFDEPDYGDVSDFLNQLTTAGLTTRNTDSVKSALQRLVIANEAVEHYNWATGIAMWLPDVTDFKRFDSSYGALQFVKASHWDDVLRAAYKGQ